MPPDRDHEIDVDGGVVAMDRCFDPARRRRARAVAR